MFDIKIINIALGSRNKDKCPNRRWLGLRQGCKHSSDRHKRGLNGNLMCLYMDCNIQCKCGWVQ